MLPIGLSGHKSDICPTVATGTAQRISAPEICRADSGLPPKQETGKINRGTATEFPRDSERKGVPEMEDDRLIEVLLVDDEDRYRITTTATLKNRGFKVRAVASGMEAIEEVKNGGVDVVVLDLKMPHMDGHQTLRQLKSLRPDLEIIMLTGYGSLGSALAERRLGVFAFLSKPCSVDFLAQRIREAYAKKGGVPEYNHKVRDIMVPLSAIATRIGQDLSIAEAVETVLNLYEQNSGCVSLNESLHRLILVVGENEEPCAVIGFGDLLKSLQQPCMQALHEGPMASHSVYLDASSYMGGFATMVCEKASQTLRDLLSGEPPSIDQDADLMEATEKVLSLKVTHLLVLDGHRRPVGVLREKDLFLEMAKIMREHRSETIEEAAACNRARG